MCFKGFALNTSKKWAWKLLCKCSFKLKEYFCSMHLHVLLPVWEFSTFFTNNNFGLEVYNFHFPDYANFQILNLLMLQTSWFKERDKTYLVIQCLDWCLQLLYISMSKYGRVINCIGCLAVTCQIIMTVKLYSKKVFQTRTFACCVPKDIRIQKLNAPGSFHTNEMK